MAEYVNDDPMKDQAPEGNEQPAQNEQALLREYMIACIRAKSPGDLHGLDDDSLMAVYAASGPPRVAFVDWARAMVGGSGPIQDQDPEKAEKEQEGPKVKRLDELDEEELRRLNESSLDLIEADAKRSGLDFKIEKNVEKAGAGAN